MSQISDLASLKGQVVTIRITTEQLKLLARAAFRCTDLARDTFSRTDAEQYELVALAELCNNVGNNPDSNPDAVYGFAL